jgi:hypothetical protein
MRRSIKLAWLLPLAQLVLAIFLLSWARHYPHPPVKIDSPWTSTAERLVEGINLPATRIVEMALDVSPWTNTGVPGIGGFYFVDWMFICGVVGLWYLVGKKLDNYQSLKLDTKRGPLARTAVWDVLLALYGLYLLIPLLLHNVVFTNPKNGTGGDANFVGSFLFQSLWFTWSLLLISFATWEFVRAIRTHPATVVN